MTGMEAPIFKIILFLLFIFSRFSANEIDIFNILLPTAYHSTHGHAKQLITTSGGCYIWDSTDQQVTSVKGIIKPGEECQSDSVVSVLHQGPYISSVYITAKEDISLATTRIPVRIRDLQRISIFTKSRVMNLNEVQSLEIYGFDRENNTFTSLEGLAFRWELKSIDGQLHKISLRQSLLYTPLDTRKKLEDSGFDSDLLVVKAAQVGTIEVTVQCLEFTYTAINDRIIVVVQERFEISPTRIDLLAGSSYQFYLLSQFGVNISLPSPQYVADISNQFKVSDTLLVTAPPMDSETRLNVSDQRTSPPFWSSVQVSSFQPDQMEIISPRQIVIGRKANYSVQFYRNGVLLEGTTQNLRVTVPTGFHVDVEHSKITASTKTAGKIRIDYQGLSTQRQINSVTPVSVILPTSAHLLVFPVGQSYQLRTVGGSGVHHFVVADGSLARLSMSGLLTTRSEGETEVTVCDSKNPDNCMIIKLVVVGPIKINSLEPRVQSNFNEFSQLFIRVIPNTKIVPYFTECNDAFKKIAVKAPGESGVIEINSIYGASAQALASLLIESADNSFLQKALNSPAAPRPKSEFEKQYQLHVSQGDITLAQLSRIVDEITNYGICSKINYKGRAEYQGTVQVTIPDAQPANIQMRLYRELQTIKTGHSKDETEWLSPDGLQQPITQIYMTPLSSFTWEVQGGPFGWQQPAEVYLNGIRNKQNPLIITCPASVEPSTKKYIRQIRNPISQKLLRPAAQEQELVVHCQLPHRLKLTPMANMNARNSHIYKMRESIIYIYPKQQFYLLVEPLTSTNQVFYNCSNVDYTAHPAVGKVAVVKAQKHYWVLEYNNNEMGQDQINFKMSGASGTVLYPHSQRDQPNLKQTLFVMTMQPLQITNADQGITITNTPTETHSFKIDVPGSIERTYSIKCADESLLSCTRQGSILKLQSRGLSGTTDLEIIDETIIGAPRQLIPVKVLQPNIIDLRIMGQRASLNRDWVIEGEPVEVSVRIYSTEGGQRIPIDRVDPEDLVITFEQRPEMKELRRHYHSQNNSISIHYLTQASVRTGQQRTSDELTYVLKARMSKYPVSSNEVEIKVFRPISTKGGSRLNKDFLDSVMIILSSCQQFIQITGGPPKLQSQVLIDSGQGLTHRLTKIDERRYGVEGLRQTEGDEPASITGEQDNLIVIKVQYEGKQLGRIRYLISVQEINSFTIVGISSLIPGKQARLLAETDKIGLLNTASCDFKMAWKSNGNSIAITSDSRRNGINITATRAGMTSIQLTVSDHNDKVLASASKQINVVQEYMDPQLPLNDVILLAPNSAMPMPAGTSAEEISPCATGNQDIKIAENWVRAAANADQSARVIKFSAADHNDVPAYVTILIAQICGVILQNTDGIINLRRGIPSEIHYNVIDCYGRKFSPLLTGVEYRVSTGSRDLAVATLLANNIIKIDGHLIGSTILTIEIVGRQKVVKDVVPVHVNVHIEPSHPITILVGDEVRFTGGQAGQNSWQSSDSRGLAVDRITGVTLARQEGEYRIKHSNMESKVTVMQIIGLQKGSGVFTYRPIYSTEETPTQHANIKRRINWHCKVLGEENEYLQAVPKLKTNEFGSEEVVCQLQQISANSRLKSSPKTITIRVSVEGPDSGFSVSKDFVEDVQSGGFFTVLTDRLIDPTEEPKNCYIVIETREKLDVRQSGGRDEWIIADQFNRLKQVITLDLKSRESQLATWHVIIQNQHSWQKQIVTISREKAAQTELEKAKSGWKWTDWLVLLMAINFLVIFIYQVMQKNSSAGAYKVY